MATVVSTTSAQKHEYTRTGLSVESLKRAFIDNLIYEQGKYPELATKLDYYMAIASSVRDRLLQRWVDTVATYRQQDVRVVCYLSAEYLLGPQLGKNLLDLGIEAEAKSAMEELGLNVQDIIDEEEEPGLGNGGLGRLAACFMDSLATLEIPAFGYGIRYEYGIFDQTIRDGWQQEITDNWLHTATPGRLPDRSRRCASNSEDTRKPIPTIKGSTACDGLRTASLKLFRMIRRCSATGPTPLTRCVSGKQKLSSPSTSERSTLGTISGLSGRKYSLKTFQRSSTRTTKRSKGRSCAWSSNTFLP